MKQLGDIEETTLCTARLKSKSMRTTVPREVVSLLKLDIGDKIAWKKILDNDGIFGNKGEILAVVTKRGKGRNTE